MPTMTVQGNGHLPTPWGGDGLWLPRELVQCELGSLQWEQGVAAGRDYDPQTPDQLWVEGREAHAFQEGESLE